MRKWLRVAVMFFAGTVSACAFAHGKHVHGEAEMNVAVDGNDLTVEMQGPLGNFLGFEHAPQDEKQKKALVDMTAALHEARELIVPNSDAACSYVSGRVALKKGAKTVHPVMLKSLAGKDGDGHVDLVASWSWYCEKPESLKTVRLPLFARFPGLERVDAQVLLPKKQVAASATPQKPVLSW
ncbi:DUF2796 domain-containing protein [Oxalobacter sp. OttesenSCG-928-P03]|nr:DUF2796 domain-containing protein [Oxalobacter sp. OttesenSCG-928-P03]